MDYFAALRAFVRAADSRSFSRAAVDAGVKVSTVSRQISALEEDVGAALLNRSTRGISLTEVGRTFYARAVGVLADLDEARATATALNRRPHGTLSINIPGAFGRLHVMPHLDAFMATYPDIQVDATLTDATVDLFEAGADLAVRIGALNDSSLIARRLAGHNRVLVASPGYLAAHSAPLDHPEDLSHHDCLSFALQPSDAWYFRERKSDARLTVRVTGRLRANDSEALRHAALKGLGLALLPTWLVGDDILEGRLISPLPQWECLIAPGAERAIWAVYPPQKIVPAKTSVFINFLHERFGEPPYWERHG